MLRVCHLAVTFSCGFADVGCICKCMNYSMIGNAKIELFKITFADGFCRSVRGCGVLQINTKSSRRKPPAACQFVLSKGCCPSACFPDFCYRWNL